MSLLPRALRPKTILRRTAMKRSAEGGGVAWRALSYYFIGGVGMVRTQAIVRGVVGGSTGWRAVGLLVLLTNNVLGAFRRQPETIAEERLRVGEFVKVSTFSPLSRKEQKRTGITRRVLQDQALADVAAAKGDHLAS